MNRAFPLIPFTTGDVVCLAVRGCAKALPVILMAVRCCVCCADANGTLCCVPCADANGTLYCVCCADANRTLYCVTVYLALVRCLRPVMASDSIRLQVELLLVHTYSLACCFVRVCVLHTTSISQQHLSTHPTDRVGGRHWSAFSGCIQDVCSCHGAYTPCTSPFRLSNLAAGSNSVTRTCHGTLECQPLVLRLAFRASFFSGVFFFYAIQVLPCTPWLSILLWGMLGRSEQ